MSIKIESTTDSPEAVSAAMSDLAKENEVVDPAAEESAESQEASGASEELEEGDGSQEKKPPESQGDEKPKKKNGFKKRIERLNKRLSEKDQQIAYWQSQATKTHQDGQESVSNQTEKPDASGKPKQDDFDSHEEWVEALAEWKADQKIQVAETKRKESEVKSEFQKRAQKYVEQVKTFAEEHEDFQEVMEDVDDIPMSVTVQEAILSSENGPELAYQMAKNRDLYEQICRMPALQAARAIGKFEASLTKSETPAPKKVTKAPPPPKPVGSNAVSSIKKSIDDPNLSQREYERLRAQQQAKRAKSAW